MVLVRGDAALAEELAARSDVARLAANPTVRMPAPPQEESVAGVTPQQINAPTAIEWGLTKIRAPEMWNAGFTGQSIVVAGADTGYDWTHPAIRGKYRGTVGNTANHNFNWHDAVHFGGGVCGPDSIVPCDDQYHGTHTMGTMVGDDGVGNQIGVAPGAKWIGCRNMNQDYGTPATYTECFQWFIAPTDLAGNNPTPALAPHVINNSWGCTVGEGCDAAASEALRLVVESVRAAGIVVVASAGNDGSACSTVASPAAIYQASFTVGSTNASDNLASSSSRGPVTVDGSNRLKPTISAPGVSVRSSTPGGSYALLSGTSMAGPHVAGAAALLMSAYPALIGKPDLLQTRLERSAVPRTAAVNCGGTGTAAPNNEYGWGRLDVKAAYDAPFAKLDVDNNGVSEPSKDGVLIMRYLLGIRGSALTSGAIGVGARRTLATDIETYLGTLLQ
jgi:subtilisin family serine protease